MNPYIESKEDLKLAFTSCLQKSGEVAALNKIINIMGRRIQELERKELELRAIYLESLSEEH